MNTNNVFVGLCRGIYGNSLKLISVSAPFQHKRSKSLHWQKVHPNSAVRNIDILRQS